MKNYHKKTILIFSLLFLFVSCDNDPCEGIPKVIETTEKFLIKIVNNQNESIFSEEFEIDSLIIKENKKIIDFELLSDDIIEFNLNSISFENIKNNYGTDLKIEILFQFNSIVTDTMAINLKPVIFPEKCNSSEYEYIDIFYNSILIKHSENTGCIICNYNGIIFLLIER